MAKSNIYNDDSIKSISPREFTRLHPGTYAGSVEYSTQLLKELFANALDEHNIGHGNLIEITVDTFNNIYTITDHGQGFPYNVKRDDGETVLQAAFDVLNTSGKYDEDGVYGASALGLNGIGGKLVNFLSDWCIVSSCSIPGKVESLQFKDGIFVKKELGTNSKEVGTGTIVQYHPDPQFFHNPQIDFTDIRQLFKGIAALCPTLTITFTVDGQVETYHSENGIQDLINEKVKGNEILTHRFASKHTDGDNLFDICITYTNSYSEDMTAYVNYGLTDGGVHITALHGLLTRVINNYARENKLLKDKEENFTGAELSEGMMIVFNLKANGVQYDSQSKTRVVDINKTLLTTTITNDFAIWLSANANDAKVIIDKALTARRAREAAKKAKETVRGQEEKKKKALKFASKLADCNNKDRSQCEIYITEGDSATGGLKMGRDEKFQAVMPVRGKILNCQKATLQQIQKNAEIMTMIDAFGLTIDTKTMKVSYNPEDLRYGKIIIMSDADVDGAHIKNLFYTFIWNFCPQLIEDGYVYAGVPPLYKITEKNGKSYKYLKDDAALEEYRKEHKNEKYVVGRMKGLGEMDEDEVAETLMNPENRIIKQITIEDRKKAAMLFEQMMGDSVGFRKEFLKEHSAEATYNAE